VSIASAFVEQRVMSQIPQSSGLLVNKKPRECRCLNESQDIRVVGTPMQFLRKLSHSYVQLRMNDDSASINKGYRFNQRINYLLLASFGFTFLNICIRCQTEKIVMSAEASRGFFDITRLGFHVALSYSITVAGPPEGTPYKVRLTTSLSLPTSYKS
jgi:hypothetical protein